MPAPRRYRHVLKPPLLVTLPLSRSSFNLRNHKQIGIVSMVQVVFQLRNAQLDKVGYANVLKVMTGHLYFARYPEIPGCFQRPKSNISITGQCAPIQGRAMQTVEFLELEQQGLYAD
ncbi:hypothetical protein [Parasitella parasitica]|uniref:Uncharacterized protein n=1 Tax=Parasitella parasitica TaxID=35722 RepID=A0A0B7ND17_9FUNG|nr:hypothetical protein [Parasitella parasitica]